IKCGQGVFRNYYLHFRFFFSSRRRHTRSKRDWSSDVCSSDLVTKALNKIPGVTATVSLEDKEAQIVAEDGVEPERMKEAVEDARSEERRVGKEGRGRRGRGEEMESIKKGEKTHVNERTKNVLQ